ncbi:MAG TPA: YggS family pyridoxal phosphate-dependent enzyme [Clostridiaceae bacterium]|nr:YggS family pyridoxal phosphate-dependent enzyme [Clostridiaceae bacterium]
MDNAYDDVKKNITSVMERVSKAAIRSGRKPEMIKVVAVTKNVEPERIMKALSTNVIRNLGENRVQELVEKYEFFSSNEMYGKIINWHLIGHLQSNKVKYIVDKVKMIHSLDSIKLAREINDRMEKIQKIMDVLVEVNVAEEETKYGIRANEVEDFLEEVKDLKYIKVKGLMTVAPKVTDPEEVRPVFRELKKIFIDISRKNIDNIDMVYLSMGMSNDFEVAIEEGANIVRIGTSIFGKREYK